MFVPPHLLVHLPYLAQVARYNSFTKAAEALHVTQAAVSYQVKQLESKTGSRLVVRQSGGKTRLTEAGKLLVQEFTGCDKRLRLALEQLNYREGAGVLRITTPVDFGSLVMPKVMAMLRQMAPELTIHCHTDDTIMDLSCSDWDMAISFVDYHQSAPADIIYRSPLRLVASGEYLNTHGTPETVEALVHHILLTRYGSANRGWQQVFSGANVKPDEPVEYRQLGNTFALLEAAKTGLGIALLPEFCVSEALACQQLLCVCDGLNLPATRFYLRRITAPQMEHFETLLVKAFAQIS